MIVCPFVAFRLTILRRTGSGYQFFAFTIAIQKPQQF